MSISAGKSGITPIILVGMNRSGTKWVSNILCGHDDVVGIQSERAKGILETNMFGIMQTKFDLSSPDDYLGLIELWSATEFFTVAAIEKSFFYEQSVRPRSVVAVFRLLMDEVARRSGKQFWLQKTSPLRVEPVLGELRGARVVVVRRDIVDTLRSTWRLQQRRGSRRAVRSIYAIVRQRKALDRIVRKHDAIEVYYERLKKDPMAETRRLFAALGLATAGASPDVGFEKNTSFEQPAQRSLIMSPREEILVRAAAFIVGLVPLFVLEASASVRQRLGKLRPSRLMPGTFGPLFDALKDKSRT